MIQGSTAPAETVTVQEKFHSSSVVRTIVHDHWVAKHADALKIPFKFAHEHIHSTLKENDWGEEYVC